MIYITALAFRGRKMIRILIVSFDEAYILHEVVKYSIL